MCRALSEAVLNCRSLGKGKGDVWWGGCSSLPPTVAAAGCLRGGQAPCRGAGCRSPPALALVTSQHCRQRGKQLTGMEDAPNKC